jgi:hypothetical protein
MKEEFDYSLLKAATKRLSYKCLQRGQIDTAEKIQQTFRNRKENSRLRSEARSMKELSLVFAINQMLLEFDALNRAIIRIIKN